MMRTIHRAKYLLADSNILLKNAALHISNSGRISHIESLHSPLSNPMVKVIDWGSAAIMPGLINAHAHLELTSFNNQLTQFNSFTDWILQLIRRRQTWTEADFISSAKEGASLALASGTTLIGDISASGVLWEAAKNENLRRVLFEEVVALSPNQANRVVSRLNLLLESSDLHPLLIHAVSPHAPYSVSPELYRHTARLAQQRGMLLTTHIAETKAELQFLQTGSGEFRSFLERIGALPINWDPPALAPIPYLDSLGVLGRFCLLVHANYLDRESIEMISHSQSNVVYCPRSHDFFGHEKHPIRQLLDSAINVAMGTDSLASNSSLSMIDEMRYLYKKRKDVQPEEIFRAATQNGAIALGFRNSLGRIKRGYWADLSVLGLPKGIGPKNLLHQILEGAGECIATVVQGRVAWQKPNLQE
jgi:cytosine/adenosine deaminase-related metal-dependent hydrolase